MALSTAKRVGQIVLVIAFVVAVISPFAVDAHKEICETPKQGDGEHCSTYSVISIALTSLGEFLHRNDGAITAIGTLVVALFTWRLFVATDKLWDAGERQLALTRENMERELRAYVFLGDISAAMIGDLPQVFWGAQAINLGIKNTGSTPTRHLIARQDWDFFAQPIGSDYVFGKSKGGYSSNLLIPPHDRVHGARIQLSNEEIEDVASGKCHLYMWGSFDYNDVFKGTDRHTTEFYFKVTVAGTLGGPGGRMLLFEPVEGWPHASDGDARRKAEPYKEA